MVSKLHWLGEAHGLRFEAYVTSISECVMPSSDKPALSRRPMLGRLAAAQNGFSGKLVIGSDLDEIGL